MTDLIRINTKQLIMKRKAILLVAVGVVAILISTSCRSRHQKCPGVYSNPNPMATEIPVNQAK